MDLCVGCACYQDSVLCMRKELYRQTDKKQNDIVIPLLSITSENVITWMFTWSIYMPNTLIFLFLC